VRVSLGHGLGGGTVNTGVTHALGVNGQVDVEVGRSVSGHAQDWFVGVGVAVRHFYR
jgi:hypothetical protein